MDGVRRRAVQLRQNLPRRICAPPIVRALNPALNHRAVIAALEDGPIMVRNDTSLAYETY